MKNIEHWKPSKFVLKNGKLQASRNELEVSVSSRFAADLVAVQYDEHLKNHVRGKLVDLGCGKVPLYESYKKFASACTCADWESSIHQNPFLDITCDLNAPLPFGSEEFDTVILSDVLEHIAKPEALWNEMFRILKPGGKIILNVPFFYKLHETPHDYFRYTKYALQNFALSAGLKLILLKEIGGLPEILTDLSAKFSYHTPLVGKYLSIGLQQLARLLMHFSIGKKLSEKTKEHFPLGYFMIVEK
jgi:SAM-dependent methyltransferase